MTGPTVVLVHGAWHGAWCWDAVRSGLEGRGVRVVAEDLPLTGTNDDVDSVRALIDQINADGAGPVVLVGHSYGGMVITQAAAGRDDVGHLVYVCAFMPDAGEDLRSRVAEFPTVALTQAVAVSDGNLTRVDPAVAPAAFYQHCTAADIERALSRLRPMRRDAGRSFDRAPWRDIPSTYAVCAADQAIHPDLQRELASRATATVEWDSDHSPFVSHPDLVVDLLSDVAQATSGR